MMIVTKSPLETMIEKLKNGETVFCQKCKKGIIVYQKNPNEKFPKICCNNAECNAKIHFN